MSYSDIENHTNYSGSAFGVSGSVAMNFNTPLGKYGQAQSNKQAVNEQGEKLYITAKATQPQQAEIVQAMKINQN